jgi:hypothetical protein
MSLGVQFRIGLYSSFSAFCCPWSLAYNPWGFMRGLALPDAVEQWSLTSLSLLSLQS